MKFAEPLFGLLLAAAAARSGEAARPDDPVTVKQALAADDACLADGQEEGCAVSALQFRATLHDASEVRPAGGPGDPARPGALPEPELAPGREADTGGTRRRRLSSVNGTPPVEAEAAPTTVNATTPRRAAGNATAPPAGDAAADEFYWDGQCRPCPAHLYRHCARGGEIVGHRRCGTAGAYCEAKCSGSPTLSPPGSPGVMTLYHTTSPEIAEKILAEGFRPGSHGWCGGAIYFFGSPELPETKLGSDSHTGAVIEVQVDLGKMAHLNSRCDGAYQAKLHYDSVKFNPGDGDEYIVFSNSRVISMKRYK